MNTVISERQGKLTSLRNITDPLPTCGTSAPSATNVVLGKPGCAGVAPIFSNPTLRNFEPRFGFAWDPSGNGKTAVRGGFAIFDVLPLPGYFFSQAWAPFFLTGTVVDSPASPLSGTLGIPPTAAGSAYSNFFSQTPNRDARRRWGLARSPPRLPKLIPSEITSSSGISTCNA